MSKWVSLSALWWKASLGFLEEAAAGVVILQQKSLLGRNVETMLVGGDSGRKGMGLEVGCIKLCYSAC